MQDIDGNEVRVGDLVEILYQNPNYFGKVLKVIASDSMGIDCYPDGSFGRSTSFRIIFTT